MREEEVKNKLIKMLIEDAEKKNRSIRETVEYFVDNLPIGAAVAILKILGHPFGAKRASLQQEIFARHLLVHELLKEIEKYKKKW